MPFFTCAFGAGALLVDRECVSTSCLGVGISTRTSDREIHASNSPRIYPASVVHPYPIILRAAISPD